MFTIASVIGDKTNNQFREELIAYVVQSTVYKALLIFFIREYVWFVISFSMFIINIHSMVTHNI